MSDTPWHKRYHSDALTGYMELSLEERGAYTTFLDMMYDRGEPLKDNERLLAGYLGVSLRKYRTIRESLIEKGKIYVTDDDKISNRRFDKERENVLKTSRKRAENGKLGAEKTNENKKKHNKNNECDAANESANGRLYQIPDTRSQKEYIDQFENDLWPICLRKVGKGQARKAYLSALKKTSHEEIMVGMRRYVEANKDKDIEFIAHPATWLNGERWSDEQTERAKPKW